MLAGSPRIRERTPPCIRGASFLPRHAGPFPSPISPKSAMSASPEWELIDRPNFFNLCESLKSVDRNAVSSTDCTDCHSFNSWSFDEPGSPKRTKASSPEQTVTAIRRAKHPSRSGTRRSRFKTRLLAREPRKGATRICPAEGFETTSKSSAAPAPAQADTSRPPTPVPCCGNARVRNTSRRHRARQAIAATADPPHVRDVSLFSVLAATWQGVAPSQSSSPDPALPVPVRLVTGARPPILGGLPPRAATLGKSLSKNPVALVEQTVDTRATRRRQRVFG